MDLDTQLQIICIIQKIPLHLSELIMKSNSILQFK